MRFKSHLFYHSTQYNLQRIGNLCETIGDGKNPFTLKRSHKSHQANIKLFIQKAFSSALMFVRQNWCKALHQAIIPTLFTWLESMERQLLPEHPKSSFSPISRTKLPESHPDFKRCAYPQDIYNHSVIELELASALELKEFFLLYQPQISLKNRKIRGIETLIRWQNPCLGLISPADFIPRLEKNGDIIPVGYWILYQACCHFQQCFSSDPQAPILSVNISAKQLQHHNFLTKIESILEETRLAPQQLEIEITESCILHDLDLAIYTLTSIQERGIKVAIDDFGTGYSSFSVLKELPLSTLKIDKSFLRNIKESKRNQVLLRNLINLGHDLGLEVIVEGIETQEQMNFLASVGCDVIQGYYLAKPLPLENLSPIFNDIIQTAGRIREYTMTSSE